MSYQLNYAIHPGASISAAINHLGISQKNLAERALLSEKTVSQIINGEAPITADTAIKLENTLGGTAAFWLGLESQYRASLAKVEQTKRAESEIELSKNFPYSELVKRSCVEPTRDKLERVINLWKFFGVDSLFTIPSIETAAYRRGYVGDSEDKKAALAAWLRCGEITYINEVAPKLNEFNLTKLKLALPEIRKMTQMKDPRFFSHIQDILADAGVGLVAVQYFPGTKASGATRWVKTNPLIQLSTYGRNADRVWFTLFHEIGHIILHGKKDQFISFTESSKDPEEIKADDFAANQLIPKNNYMNFLKNFRVLTEGAIRRFATSQEIDPGIVLGRLKNDNILAHSAFLHLHSKLEMKIGANENNTR